jgi:hypothetical protein
LVVADTIRDTATSGQHKIYRSITTTATATTLSVYAKYLSIRWLVLRLSDSTNTARLAYFDVQNGAVGTVQTNLTANITNAGNGWYRCSVTVSAAFAGSNSIQLYLATADNTDNYTGTGTGGTYLWGAQLEAGAFATSYIPTTTTALTRNADVATITGTDFSDWWQAGRGGVSVSAIPSTVIGTRPLIQFDDATADNLIALQGNTTNPELYIVDSTTPQAQIDAGTIAAGTPYTLTGWWQTDFCAARLNNSARVVDNSATIPTVTQARLGSDGTNYLNGHLATINYYDQFSSRIYTRRKNKAVFSVL